MWVHTREYLIGVAVLIRYRLLREPVPDNTEPHNRTHLSVVSTLLTFHLDDYMYGSLGSVVVCLDFK